MSAYVLILLLHIIRDSYYSEVGAGRYQCNIASVDA